MEKKVILLHLDEEEAQLILDSLDSNIFKHEKMIEEQRAKIKNIYNNRNECQKYSQEWESYEKVIGSAEWTLSRIEDKYDEESALRKTLGRIFAYNF